MTILRALYWFFNDLIFNESPESRLSDEAYREYLRGFVKGGK